MIKGKVSYDNEMLMMSRFEIGLFFIYMAFRVTLLK